MCLFYHDGVTRLICSVIEAASVATVRFLSSCDDLRLYDKPFLVHLYRRK